MGHDGCLLNRAATVSFLKNVMKLLSPSPEAVATVLGVSLAKASAILEQRRLAEQREREARQRCLAESMRAVQSWNRAKG